MEEMEGFEVTGMPFEWKLVEVVDLAVPLEPTPQMLAIDPNVATMLANGLKGWALAWVPAEERYLIETFNGLHICISPENLQEFEPTAVSEGGFDLAFPAKGMPLEPFVESLADKLRTQYFCVIQFFSASAQGRNALKRARDLDREWACIPPEFQTTFMGRKPQGKISWLASEPYDGASEDAISYVDVLMEEVTLALAPYCPEFGFVAAGKSNGMLRMPILPEDVDVLYAEGGSMTGDDFKSFSDFTRRGKICLMYFLHGSGGSLILEPTDTSQNSVEILIEEGQMVMFDHALMNFSYNPHGKNALILQSWILREGFGGEAGAQGEAELQRFDTSQAPKALKIGASGETVDCMAISTRLLANMWSAAATTSSFNVGTDAIGAISKARWDHDVYYDPKGNGRAYCWHQGMVVEPADAFTCFDNEYWGMSEKETHTWNPCARVSLEVAFEACLRAGFTKESLRGAEFVMSMGGTTTNDYYFHDFNKSIQWDQEAFQYCQSACQYAAFIYYHIGLLGPNFVVDTACSSGLYSTGIVHSQMRPQEPGKLRYQSLRQVRNGLAGAVQANITPFTTISFCGAGMLTHQGRCFTFDGSADGYCRSEGCAFMLYQVHDKECISRYAMIGGTGMNQDGRSATLTAPNGVSQQECIRQSLREAGIRALDIQIQELHGTGTALGDPIEVGALRNTMMQEGGVVREHPLIKTSSKSCFGHMELVAGMGGILKCVLMGMWAMAQPGPHIGALNPNMDTAGYPVMFANEAVDQGSDWGYFGVSSFGFSGCNARGDIWAMATAGVRKALPIGWNLGASRHTTTSNYIIGDRYGIEQVAASNEEDWSGTFQIGSAATEWTQFHISGTWTNWADMEAPFAEQNGVYEWAFRIGDSLIEDFRIHVNQFSDYVICPAMKQATSQKTLILGPGQSPKGYTWRVDGCRDGAKAGDMYVVKFWIHGAENAKHIHWERASAELVEELERPVTVHRYYVWGSFNAWKLQELRKVDNSFQLSVRIGNSGVEEFQFCRDRDLQQLIYPAYPTVQKTNVPIRGPNHMGKGKHWGIKGEAGEVVTLKLGIDSGKISVNIISSQGTLRWGTQANLRVRYSLVFADGTLLPMVRDRENKELYMAKVRTSSDHDVQWFRIIVDEDPGVAIHPEMDGAYTGQAATVGPDALREDECPRWRLDSLPDEVFIITLDYTQRDRRSIVTCTSESA